MSIAGVVVLWILAMLLLGIVFLIRWLCDPGPGAPVVDPNTEPPNPGPFDGQKYRTPAQQAIWVEAYTKRVEWERAHPRPPIPYQPDLTVQKWS